ncbi:MAG: sulfotransferase family protein [Sulfitobacter sp.]
MIESARTLIKTAAGRIAMIAPQARFDRGILVLSHMRSMTTALTNVLCSHPQISGYGETHVPYSSVDAPGKVLVNLALRRAYSPGATFFTDKLLHNRLDDAVPESFYQARGLFLARLPGPAIRSITRLAIRGDMKEMETVEGAAHYYAERLERLAYLWDRFPTSARLGFEVEKLLLDPDRFVGDIGSWLGLEPPLENRYRSHAASQKAGGGDPTASALHTRIEKSNASSGEVQMGLDLSEAVKFRCEAAHKELVERFVN